MKCPICANIVVWKESPYRPFCSERCKLIDLGAWVNEQYSVPGEEVELPEEDKSKPDDDAWSNRVE
jgi:uncharacterized protein